MKGQTDHQDRIEFLSARVRYFSNLTVSQQQLVLKFKQIEWGSMQYLAYFGGEPILRPPPKVKRIIRLKRPSSRKPQLPTDFELKQEYISFFAYLEQQQNGCIKNIEIRDGLPAEMSVEEIE
ncbi:MAG: hypothetical protein JW739_08125 [Opitutales bacterium]|nr:hypothetical protein [Opitutales bacterium]